MPRDDSPATPRRGSKAPRPSPRAHGTLYFILLCAAGALILNAMAGEMGLLRMFRARAEYVQLQEELRRARAANARRVEEIRLLNTDPATIEAIARGELGLIKPGEKLFIVKDLPAGTAGTGGAGGRTQR